MLSNIHIHVYAASHALAHTGRPDYYSETASREAYAQTFELFSALRS